MSDAKASDKSLRGHEERGAPPSEITHIKRGSRQNEIDLDFMRKTLRKSTGDEDSVVPVVLLSLTLRGAAREIGPKVAAALARYTGFIAPFVLRTAIEGDDVARLTERRVERDRAALHDDLVTPLKLWYACTPFGGPGDFGFRTYLSSRKSDTCSVRFTFPWRSGEGARVDTLVEQALALVAALPVDSGSLGLGFEHWHFDRFARDHVHTLLDGYVGFHHSVATAAPGSLGRAPSPSWLTFLGPEVVSAVGGRAALEASLPDVPFSTAGEALVLRAAEHPPVGDLAFGARDLGALPEIARVLAPHAGPLPSFGGSIVMLDETKWSKRLLDLPSRPYENR